MKIIIDADACPVVDITVNVAKERGIDHTHKDPIVQQIVLNMLG